MSSTDLASDIQERPVLRHEPELPAPQGSGESTQAAPARRGDRAATWDLAWPAALFVLLTVFIAADLAADVANGVSWVHLYTEIGAFLVGLMGVAGTTRLLLRALRRARDLQKDLLGTRVELERSRSEAEALLRRLGTVLEHPFETWGLTPAEREITLQILKGLSYKEVACERGTTERTVRHQALGIYRKAGVTGRAELAAYFLQHLLLPAP